MFAYSFLAMTSHNILKPVTKSKFIDQLGSDNLPYVLMASSVLIGVLDALVQRCDPATSPPVRDSDHAVGPRRATRCLLGLAAHGAVWVTVALYFFGQILGVLLISQFWTLANEVYDARQAKRLFGLIGGGACLGGALGASITAITVEEFGSSNLLSISAATLAICVGIVLRITRLPHAGQHVEPMRRTRGRRPRGDPAPDAVSHTSEFSPPSSVSPRSERPLSISSSAWRRRQQALTATRSPRCSRRSRSICRSPGSWSQIALTSRIHRSFGIAAALLLLPIGLGGSATLILLTGALGAVAGARVLDTTLRYSIDKTTREVLFLPLSADLRFRAKPFIDVTMDRFGKAAAAALILVLIHPGGIRVSIGGN